MLGGNASPPTQCEIDAAKTVIYEDPTTVGRISYKRKERGEEGEPSDSYSDVEDRELAAGKLYMLLRYIWDESDRTRGRDVSEASSGYESDVCDTDEIPVRLSVVDVWKYWFEKVKQEQGNNTDESFDVRNLAHVRSVLDLSCVKDMKYETNANFVCVQAKKDLERKLEFREF